MTEPKTLADKYADAVDQIAALSAQVASLSVEADKVSVLIGERDAAVAERETAKADLASAIAQHTEAAQAKDARIVELEADLNAAQGKLALSPGHISIAGTDPVEDKGAGSDAGASDIEAQYLAIKDPAARTEFFRTHRDQLLGISPAKK